MDIFLTSLPISPACQSWIEFTLGNLTKVAIKATTALLIWLVLHLTYKAIPEDI